MQQCEAAGGGGRRRGRAGGRQACCALDIRTAGRSCNGASPPCVPLKATPLLANITFRQQTHDQTPGASGPVTPPCRRWPSAGK